ncbi:MAG: alpha-ketoacid dehydrogenase subunit beta [Candidatus Atribacteria bacterium]|nr:alpha-ketoacid dehydrogenase subunit beta [Candidatus Atribacteria bacterium]
MRQISYREALHEVLDYELQINPDVFLLGEDIGPLGGAFGVTTGLWQKYGNERVRNTPLSEIAIVGAATGAASVGMRPVAEIMFCDFLFVAGDQLINQTAKMRYMFGDQCQLPLVIRTVIGAGQSAAAQHSQSLEGLLAHIPGFKSVIPSTPYDAKGLLKTAIEDNNPVLFYEHKSLYNMKGEVPEEMYSIPFGVADVKRKGKDVTVIATAEMVHKSLRVADRLQKEGIDVEIIDPRTLVPLDMDTIINSVKKTHKAVVVHEAHLSYGPGAEIVARLADEAFDYLDAPLKRVGAKDVPIPMAPHLESFVIPQEEDIYKAIKSVVD